MTNTEKYNAAFKEAFDINIDEAVNARRNTQKGWDSIGQMSLIAILEDEFSIEFAPEDILKFDSYNEGLVILASYGIKFPNV